MIKAVLEKLDKTEIIDLLSYILDNDYCHFKSFKNKYFNLFPMSKKEYYDDKLNELVNKYFFNNKFKNEGDVQDFDNELSEFISELEYFKWYVSFDILVDVVIDVYAVLLNLKLEYKCFSMEKISKLLCSLYMYALSCRKKVLGKLFNIILNDIKCNVLYLVDVSFILSLTISKGKYLTRIEKSLFNILKKDVDNDYKEDYLELLEKIDKKRKNKYDFHDFFDECKLLN